MSPGERETWNQRHRGKRPGRPEQFVTDAIPLLKPGGRVLDVACGRGRHSLALARAGMRVVAVDYSWEAIRPLPAIAHDEGLKLMAVVADVLSLPLRSGCFDAVINVNFLERTVISELIDALGIGGLLLFDTFLIDQAQFGHPRDPDFLLRHGELRELLALMEVIRYHEGRVVDSDGHPSWRASALARRRS